ncbi:MAG: alkaline phosphatase D, partial [Candidatus Paceibacteria bacterium]
MPMLPLLACLPLCVSLSWAPQEPSTTTTYRASFPPGVERTWIGPGFHGNRLQDWQLSRGRLECVQGTEAKPCRVLHALDATVNSNSSHLQLTVDVGALEAGALPGPDTWAGFLLGAGGSNIDYRLTALVHHRPATDGGLIAGVDGDGRAVFRDFEHNERPGGWGITG